MIARRDVVRCFSCKVVVQDWERSDDVIGEHHKYSPHCPYLQSFSSSILIDDQTSRKSIDKISFKSIEPVKVAKSRDSQQLRTETLDVKHPLEEKNTSTTQHHDDDISGIHYPPSWYSNPPKLSEESNESFHSAESRYKNDYSILSSVNPSKAGIQVRHVTVKPHYK